MLVTAPGWELPTGEGFAANNPLIGYDNLVTIDNITATSSDADFPVTNLANVSTALKWVSASLSSQFITIDTDGLGEIDYVGIAAHNFGTGGVAVSIEGTTIDSPTFDELTSPITPTDDRPLVFRFPPQEFTDIRIKLVPTGTFPEAAVVYVGTLLVMQQGIQSDHIPLPIAMQLDVVNGRSESGNFLGRIITGSRLASTASFANLDGTWVLNNILPLVDEGFQEPFFWVWKPTTLPEQTAFAWMVNDPQVSVDLEGTVAFDFDLVGIA